MPAETRAQTRRAEQRRLIEAGDRISNPDVLGLILDRLPGAEAWLVAGHISRAFRQRAAPRREAAQQQAARVRAFGALWYDRQRGSAPLPLWFLKKQWPQLTEQQRANAAARAARHSDLGALQWMGGRLEAWDSGACAAAAAGGHLAVLRWLRQREPPCPWDEATWTAAFVGGHLQVLRWLRRQVRPRIWKGYCLLAAARFSGSVNPDLVRLMQALIRREERR